MIARHIKKVLGEGGTGMNQIQIIWRLNFVSSALGMVLG